METKQLIDVRLTRQFSVPPQRVFDAWTNSKTAGKWLFAAGQSSCVEIDARVGGWFYIAGRRNGQKVEYVGEYLDVVRPHQLVFALLAEKYSLNFERVTVELNVRESGCELSLTHATKPEFMQLARRDWANVFERLAACSLRPAATPPERHRRECAPLSRSPTPGARPASVTCNETLPPGLGLWAVPLIQTRGH